MKKYFSYQSFQIGYVGQCRTLTRFVAEEEEEGVWEEGPPMVAGVAEGWGQALALQTIQVFRGLQTWELPPDTTALTRGYSSSPSQDNSSQG